MGVLLRCFVRVHVGYFFDLVMFGLWCLFDVLVFLLLEFARVCCC